MTKTQALKTLEEMSDENFMSFLNNLPTRVQLCVKGGLVDWREVLPGWYIKQRKEGKVV